MTGSKGSREIRKKLAREGWTFIQTKNGHWKGTHPDTDGWIIVPGSPSDHRSAQNCFADARRALRAGR